MILDMNSSLLVLLASFVCLSTGLSESVSLTDFEISRSILSLSSPILTRSTRYARWTVEIPLPCRRLSANMISRRNVRKTLSRQCWTSHMNMNMNITIMPWRSHQRNIRKRFSPVVGVGIEFVLGRYIIAMFASCSRILLRSHRCVARLRLVAGRSSGFTDSLQSLLWIYVEFIHGYCGRNAVRRCNVPFNSNSKRFDHRVVTAN